MTEARPLAPQPEPGPSTPVHVMLDEYQQVAKAFAEEADTTAGIYQQLRQKIADMTGAAGNDDPAQKFAARYTPAAHEVFAGITRFIRLLGSIARGLQTSAENHRKADADTAPGAGRIDPYPRLVINDCPAMTEPAPILGSGDTSILATVDDWVLPYFPEGDSGKLSDLGTAWTTAQHQLEAVRDRLTPQVHNLVSNNTSEELGAFEEFWIRCGSGGGADGILIALPQTCHAIGAACDEYSRAIVKIRERIREQLDELTAELAISGIIEIAAAATRGRAAIIAAGGEAVLNLAAARMAAIVKELTVLVNGGAAVTAVADAAGTMTAAISNTPEPNISQTGQTQAGQVGESEPSQFVKNNLSDYFADSAKPKASDLEQYALSQGWRKSQTADGPPKYIDQNGIVRITIKRGSARTPGSESPHVELRNSSGDRVDPFGNSVTRRSPRNHAPIEWDWS